MDKLLDKFLPNLKPRHDDNIVDRFNYIYTPMMFFGFALTIAAKQYVGEPLQCWPPAEFKGSWEKYMESFCFIENTYFVGFDESKFPTNKDDRESREIIYYQWVPFFLAVQMFLFILPKYVWDAFSWKTGFDISSLVAQALKIEKKAKKLKNAEDCKEHSGNVASQIERSLTVNTIKYTRSCRDNRNVESIKDEEDLPEQRSQQNFVSLLYISYKILNLLNCVIQLYLLNTFLGSQTHYKFWGFGVIDDLLHGRKWKESGHFPRVTYCDVVVRQPGRYGTLKYTLQCVLMINMFNEKIYIFVWFWLVFLAILNIVDCLSWIWAIISWRNSIHFVKKRLEFAKESGANKVNLEKFVKTFLSRDGCTTLRLIDKNCGHIVCADITKVLWENFKHASIDSYCIKNEVCFSKKPTSDSSYPI